MSSDRKVLAVAAAVVLAVYGVAVPLRTVVVGPGAPPSSSPSPGASASPMAYDWPERLEAGTYATRFVWDAPVEFTFTVPDGWESRDGGIIKDPISRTGEVGGPRGLTVMALPLGDVYADPCGHVLHDPPVGYSVDEFATALAGLPGVTVTAPTSGELGGFRGSYLELSVPDSIPCAPMQFFMWDAEQDSIRPEAGVTGGSTGFYAERPNHRIWVLDVEGIPYLVDAMSAADATPDDLAELQGVLDSIRIRWTSDAASMGPCSIELTDPVTGGVLDDPISVTLGQAASELRGMAPVDEDGEPLTPAPPFAQIDFTATGSGFGDRPGAPRLVGPKGESGGPVAWDESRRGTGFTTAMAVGGYQGSFVFDAPGSWLATIQPDRCFRHVPVTVVSPTE
ncbi:MAG: hypothetical protein ABWZ82_01225 [Candidatus Limnocylindrales bacterium]